MIATRPDDVLVKYRFRAGGKKKPLLLHCTNLELTSAVTNLVNGNALDNAPGVDKSAISDGKASAIDTETSGYLRDNEKTYRYSPSFVTTLKSW